MTFLCKIRDEKQLEKLTGYPELLRTLLYNRGIKIKEEAEVFLQPDYERDIHDPFLMPDMDKAVERILQVLINNERIIIYSDYDADGIPGGVILHDFFKKINYENFSNYIPHRHLEGFGLNHEAIDKFKEEGVSLIITVDCGIADLAEAETIRKHKIDLIVTDHHEQKEKLPVAVAIIDPKRKDSKYPFKDLCGAGVAYKLVQAVLIAIREQDCSLRLTKTNRSENNPAILVTTESKGTSLERLVRVKRKGSFLDFAVTEGWEKWLLDMVGIATLSDMVPLIGENRVLASYGLKVLRKSPRVGLLKLLRLLRIEQKNLVEDDIGFSISPRINAASRMGSPEEAFKLFIATDEGEADILARHLDHINNERKGVVASIVKEARKIMKDRYTDPLTGGTEKKVIVIGNPDWKPSLLGLVANSLVDDHNRPVFLWGRDGGDILKGSCRGDGRVSILDLMTAVEEGIFEDYGGHSMSGGFSIISEQIHLLEEKLQLAYEKISAKSSVETTPTIADIVIKLDDVTVNNYRLLDKLSPFGIGNNKPLFLFKKVQIINIKMFGKEENHLELTFNNSQARKIKAIGFFMTATDFGKELKVGAKIDLLANLENSTFRGFSELRLRIVDINV